MNAVSDIFISKWDIVPLKSVCQFHKGLAITKQDLVDSGAAVLSYGQIHAKDNTGVHLKNEFLRYIPIQLAQKNTSYELGLNDVLFADTSEDLEGVGNATLIDRKGVFAGYHTISASFNKSVANGRYMAYLFTTDAWRCQLRASASGIKVLSITQKMLKASKVLLPPLDAQIKICSYLDARCAKIDSMIAAAKANIEDYKALKQSVITQAVTKGLDPNVEMKDSGVEWIGKIPKEWIAANIRRECVLQTGMTPSTKNSEWFDGDLLWATPGDFTDNYNILNSQRTLSLKAKKDNVAVLVPTDTVLVVGIGATAGKVAFTTKESSFNQQVTALITKSLCSRYLMYWMIASATCLRGAASFTTLPILNNQTIGDFILIYPRDRKEQQQIATYLDTCCNELDDAIVKQQALIDDLEDAKRSLIFECVTGKRKVSD